VTFKYFVLGACVGMMVSCGSGPTVQPSPVIEDPAVDCPADINVTAHNGANPTVSFDQPTASKGAPPVTVVCTPASGTEFKSGTTTVTCEAADSRQHKTSCTFSVVVTRIPQLLKTKFMAFGDSLTEGKTSLIARGAVVVPPAIFNTSASYVEQLYPKLVARYQDQAITLVAEGKGDEEAGEGKIRLPGALAAFNPDALLLLEGVNDLLHTTDATKLPSAVDSALNALRTMCVVARGRGVKVYIATLPPLDPAKGRSAQAPSVVTLNNLIRAMAPQESATLVDLNTVVPLSLIGSDGIHPKAEAYPIIADEWMKAIQATLEANPVAP
jgi:lysophospholipase L1-like esterase